VLVGVLTRWPVAAAGLGALVAFYPRLVGSAAAEVSHTDRLEAVVSWTESLRDAGSANAGLEQMIKATTDAPPTLIGSELARLQGRLVARVPLERALDDLAVDLDHAADLIIAALRLNATRRGAGLGAVLSGLARTGREEVDLRRKITASRAGERRAMRIMVGVVIAFGAFLAIFGRGYAEPYRSVLGQIVLLVVAGIIAAAFVWIKRLTAPGAPTPFLASGRGQRTPTTVASSGGAMTADTSAGRPAEGGLA
jgi:Flp pilus assembly protein TadB